MSLPSTIGYFIKDPAAQRPYSIDWTLALPADRTIVASTWTLSGSDDVLVVTDGGFDGLYTTVWLESGNDESDYYLTNRITTDGDPEIVDERTFALHVRER